MNLTLGMVLTCLFKSYGLYVETQLCPKVKFIAVRFCSMLGFSLSL